MTTNAGQFQLTEEQLQIQEMAQRFTADNITPFAGEWDEKSHFPIDVIKQSAELGFGAIYVSEESGGIGLGRLEAALIMEAMAYGCAATSSFISIHNMAAWMIDRFGGEGVKEKYLPQLVTMEKLASYCLTEPGSGSDAAGLKTQAVLDGDHYVLNGTKQFISGGGVNDVYVTMVRTGEHKTKGITCLVVDKDTPGVSFGAPEKKLGWNASPTAQVIFEDARVPVENRVGDEGEGFRFAMMGLDGGRLNIGACSLGGAQRCLDEAVAYTKDRKQFDTPIADFQNTQFTLAELKARATAAKVFVNHCIAQHLEGKLDVPTACMAKLWLTELQGEVVDKCLQLHGGSGYINDYPIARMFRDSRVTRIFGGSNEIMKMVIARSM